MKPGTAKVAVSLPAELLEEVEAAREELGESRSAFVRRALLHLLRTRRHREDVERYVEAYLEQPEDEAGAWAAAASAAALAEHPWP